MSLPSIPRVIVTVLVVFLIYAILTSPAQSGDVTRNVWDQTKDGFNAITTFFDTLIDS